MRALASRPAVGLAARAGAAHRRRAPRRAVPGASRRRRAPADRRARRRRVAQHRPRALDRRRARVGHRGIAPARACSSTIGDEWTLADEGLSRNGSFVNGRRLRGRCRLRDGDAIASAHAVSSSVCGDGGGTTTAATQNARAAAAVRCAAARARVAVRPARRGRRSRARAPTSEIADDLYLGVETVKTPPARALRPLRAVGDLPQNRKRAELVRRAFDTGVLGWTWQRRG